MPKRIPYASDARRNPLFRPRVVKPKRGKGSYNRKSRNGNQTQKGLR